MKIRNINNRIILDKITEKNAVEFCIMKKISLAKANLRKMNLEKIDFSGLNLSEADFTGAFLKGANFTNANLTKAKLKKAYLEDAVFENANLTDTCLDPNNEPNGKCEAFQLAQKGICLGFVSKEFLYKSYVFTDARCFISSIFSTCSTENHPGICVHPVKQKNDLETYFEIINLHKAGNTYRVKKCIVVT